MRKFAAIVLVLLLLTSAVLCVHAAGSASMNGPSTVRAGDTITVSFSAGGGILGGSGTVSYDSSILTLKGYSQAIGGNWAVEFNGNNFVFFDNDMNSPITGSAVIFKASFTVNKDLAAGTEISVAATGITLSDGKADTAVGTRTYSAKIAPPLSSNCDLGTLTVSNATISPAFSATTTKYTASVPYSTSSLQVSATAADSKARVSIGNTQLTAGGTTAVRITVTAENGSTKEYVIQVTRAQDPNYVKSSDAAAKSLVVEGYALSPAFSAEVTQYYVWLPYETDTVTLKAEPADGKASLQIGSYTELTPGKGTDIPVTVTAEDGTERIYTVTVVRAPAHDDVDAFLNGEREPVEEVTEPETEPATESVTEPATQPPTEPVTEPTTDAPVSRPVVLIVTGIICLVIGICIGWLLRVLIGRKRR